MADDATRGHDSALTVALSYLARGWRVVPVTHGGKKPLNPDDSKGQNWQHLRGDEADIRRWFSGPPRNVGVILGAPSQRLVDIDLDCPEAIALAPLFLPKTEATFGRASAPRSHWLYRAPGARTQRYTDPEGGGTIVEIRADGAQTVFPGSIHASGEAIEWDALGDPLDIEAGQLQRAVLDLAAAAVVARAWPDDGGRHDAQLTLTGLLTRAGWAQERTAHFVAAVSKAAGADPEPRKRAQTARDAAERLRVGRPLRGLPAFVALLGEDRARAVCALLDVQASDGAASEAGLASASHVVLARALHERLREAHGSILFAENEFWVFRDSCWRTLSALVMRRAAHDLDGEPISGRRRPLALTRSVIDGVLNELGTLLSAPDFFQAPAPGVACENGFLQLEPDGAIAQFPHLPDQRRRHVVRGRWSPEARGQPHAESLLARLLTGSLGDDALGIGLAELLGEAAGAALFGIATQVREPVALFLHGPSAANGKSQILDLLRGVVSPMAAVSIPPAAFDDPRERVRLLGKTLNACDEIGTGGLFSDGFKQIIGGEVISARDLYKSAVEFRPQALHIFAANELPEFPRGADAGLRRRLLLVPMRRRVPDAKQIPDLARRILAEEADLVLAWAVAGARRLRKRGRFAPPRACIDALSAWITSGDVVLSWLCDAEAVVIDRAAWTPSRVLYSHFNRWARERGYTQPPSINPFSRRIARAGVEGVVAQRRSHAAGISGLRLRQTGDDARRQRDDRR